MKKTLFIGLLLAGVLVLSSCVGLQPQTSSTPIGSGTSTNGSGTTGTGYEDFQVPVFADDAYIWEATPEAGKTTIDKQYRIIISEGNSSANLAAQVLRLGISDAIGSSLVTTNDKLDNNAEREKEIILGYITNRVAASAVWDKYGTELSSSTLGIGSFFIGANGDKIMILVQDDSSLTAAVTFFLKNYVNGKSAIEIESDLSSIYYFDKVEYQSNREIVCTPMEDLMKNALVMNLKLNGVLVDGFSTSTSEYTYELQRSEEIPEISLDIYSPYATSTIIPPTAENNWTGTVSVDSGDKTQASSFTIKFNRIEYDIVNATLHKLKDGATGAITLVQDDGFKETTEIMLEIAKTYGVKFNIAMTAQSVGELQMNGSEYVFDENGNYKTNIFSGAAWWQDVIGQNSNYIEITSHSLTHSSWGLTDDLVKAEIIGSQQILRDAFEGQRVLTFAYPGFTSSSRDEEYAKAREFMAGNYVAARFLSTGKHNGLKNPNYFSLECCSLYYNDPATWGTGASNNDGWLMNSIITSCKNGGWVVTMNHQIAQTNNNLSNGSMTIDRAMFEHVVKDYIVPNMQTGVLWNGFFSEVAQYIKEYNSANLVCKTYEDGVILIDLTDEEDDELYDYALTIDVPVDETWNAATFTYTDRNGSEVTQSLAIKTAADGSRYVRVQLVPDCGTATLTRTN